MQIKANDSPGTSMTACVYDRYGSPDVLAMRELARPVPGDEEVLVKVGAVSINDWDMGLLDGSSLVNRMLNGLFKPRRKILGSDIAGRVEAVGQQVTQWRVGDEVYGDLSGTWGGFAEYVCAHASALARKPAAMSFEQAASIPQAAVLATQALRDWARLRAGQALLINGAGGGVGSFAVQVAKLDGVIVTGVDAAAKFEQMRAIGFDHLIDYRSEDFTASGRQYDLIVDCKTDRPLWRYLRALKPGGCYVTVGGSMPYLLAMLCLRPLVSLFSRKRLQLVVLKPNRDLAYLNELFEAGKLKPVIERPFAFRELPEAMRLFATSGHRGKVVVTVP